MLTLTPSMLDMIRRATVLVESINASLKMNRMPAMETVAELNMLSATLKAHVKALADEG
jgi:hypothetical protein